ncbi:type I-B CRISPR-associated endonuclease Cas1b [Desulfurobacterium sp.]|uniref:type I-B CRISPR-associated endonuclease Cas1b n=1 Tax=Desulfurobacterium sp. TaxID=2004706 RepID=UPI00260F75A5|nr:type I-B CRISPR-associated endonuclease Cas1b [Desulfurobacterium sp.]
MKNNLYITRNGIIKRKHNTVYFVFKNEKGEIVKKPLPIEKIYSIYAYGRITIKSGALSYLMKYGVPVHYFNSYGFYEGSFWPRKKLLSGNLLVNQVRYYLEKEKRLYLAKRFVEGSIKNILVNLNYYKRENPQLKTDIEKIKNILTTLENQDSIEKVMAIEGNVRETYYHSWNKFLPQRFAFDRRSRKPPENMINALISFGNSLVYSVCLTEIYNTQLNPTISYLHEPGERRFSLALDLAEVFKPLLADRIIFKLIKQEKIDETYFKKELNYCLLNDKGKRAFLQAFNEKLNTTIKHRKLKRNVTYRKLVRLECYKLIKHLIEMENYKPFVIWW